MYLSPQFLHRIPRQFRHSIVRTVAVLPLLASGQAVLAHDDHEEGARWLAGDHHIHSRYSVGWDEEVTPPAPILGGDAIYPIPMNGLMAQHFGLSWMVATDHGGPNHSKVNLERAYPELQQSRELLPDLVQFYGMELNTPGADHSSLIMPHTHDEATHLHDLESAFDRREPFPPSEERNNEALMLEALQVMDGMDAKPVVIANHPSRSAETYDNYGAYDPMEFRLWNNTAPDVAIGMAGAPGHQAASLTTSGRSVTRGYYNGVSTMGGFDPMTARVGGFWDSMLSEGRHWWITANSDSHIHYSEGGVDFWPGEYSKTYVHAEKSHDSILTNLRAGHVFVTLGDLVSEVFVTAENGSNDAQIGDELAVFDGRQVSIAIKVRDPSGLNHAGNNPQVNRIDLIAGKVQDRFSDLETDEVSTTAVIARFDSDDWQIDGEYLTMNYTIDLEANSYIRVRGTSTNELEPLPDALPENPWDDLWFYTNPIFLTIEGNN